MRYSIRASNTRTRRDQDMAIIDLVPGPADVANAAGIWLRIRHYAASHPLGVLGAAIMLVFVFAAVFANFLTSYDPLTTNAALSLAHASEAHWLGADAMGRDIYARSIFGA